MTSASDARVRIRRVHDAPDGGYRVLVDRVWPRGVAKADLEIDEWCRAVAPSTEARQDFGHRPERFAEFAARYEDELAAPGNPERPEDGGRPAAEALLDRWRRSRKKDLVLLYAARDTEHNQAVVLRDVLENLRASR